MKHLGTKTIETSRLILRRFCAEDAEAMYGNWASDPEVTKYLTWPAHESVNDARETLSQWTTAYDQPDFYQWAIQLKTLGQPIGSISVVSYNNRVKSACIGYCIGRTWWRKGITTEALKAVMGFLFDEVGVNRVESYHDVSNPNSGKVMVKCGMRYEGTLRQWAWNNRGICDVCWYSLLAEER